MRFSEENLEGENSAMPKYANTSGLASRVHDHCDITIALSLRNLIFRALICVRYHVIIATVLQILT